MDTLVQIVPPPSSGGGGPKLYYANLGGIFNVSDALAHTLLSINGIVIATGQKAVIRYTIEFKYNPANAGFICAIIETISNTTLLPQNGGGGVAFNGQNTYSEIHGGQMLVWTPAAGTYNLILEIAAGIAVANPGSVYSACLTVEVFN